jgi:heat shock protein HtpX
MQERIPMGLRAAIAAAFLIAFFALAIASAAGLIWLGIKLFGSLEHIQGRGGGMAVLGGAGCFFAAGVIVWSALPRIDRFVPPGPEIAPDDAPELFRNLAEVAAATGQAMPRHVYLVADVNAFVTGRGGLLGLGSRRVMGIGLPLLTLLDVSGLRAVIAHEFGHFHGGDTRLGPWLYRTRSAVERTIINLARSQAATSDGEAQFVALLLAAVRRPFQWFGMVFIRTTQAICRRQELSSDAFAARMVGAAATIRGLKRVHGGAPAYDAFMRRDMVPVLAAGFMAPIADGFEHFLRTAAVGEQVDRAIAKEMAEGKGDPYDSHPPLRERVQAIEALAAAPVEEDARPAAALVGDVAALEARLAPFLLADGQAVHPRIGWDELGAKVYEPRWRETARGLAIFGIAKLPIGREQLRVVMRSVGLPAGGGDADLFGWAIQAYGAYLAVALIDHGHQVSAPPGGEVTLARDGTVVEPFRRASDYLFGKLPPDQWASWLESLGLVNSSPPPPSAPEGRSRSADGS